jgi:hypothetical protein
VAAMASFPVTCDARAAAIGLLRCVQIGRNFSGNAGA